MALTKDNRRTITPTSGAEKGSKWLILRYYGHFTALLQKFSKSGRKQKNVSQPHSEPNIISLLSPAQKIEFFNKYAEHLAREAAFQMEHSRKLGTLYSIPLRLWHDQ